MDRMLPPPHSPFLRRRSRIAAGVVALCAAVAGCHTPKACDRGSVSRMVEARFGPTVGPPLRPERVIVPYGLAEGQPLAEDQAVLLALWNNALFHENLVELDLTKADLVQAGLLPNPEFVYYWPAPHKPFKYLLDFAIESIWLRPYRLKAAAAENERACARLTQLALDLIRDTRQSFADLRLAMDQLAVAERAVDLRHRIAAFAEARWKAGDVSELEAATARNDAFQADQALIRARYEVTVAAERLRNLTGLSDFTFPLIPEDAPFDPRTDLTADELVAEAVDTRPDAVAATAAVRAAAERVRVAKLAWFRVLGLLDATSGQATGHEFSPALRVTIPIFNRNQGGISRADAELEQLERRRQTVHNQIILDVRTAHARFRQARYELDLLDRVTLPAVQITTDRAEKAYASRNAPYLFMLEPNRQLIDTYARRAVLRADLRRAWAELERSVGRKLGPVVPPPQETPR